MFFEVEDGRSQFVEMGLFLNALTIDPFDPCDEVFCIWLNNSHEIVHFLFANFLHVNYNIYWLFEIAKKISLPL